MIIPIRTDNPVRRRPVMNYVLIALNVILFLNTYYEPFVFGASRQRLGEEATLREGARGFMLYPRPGLYPEQERPRLYQFVTYAFLHAGWMHIIGNMFFLYIFGGSVNDKLGHLGYLLLYLGGAVFAGLGHSLFQTNPILGASGAVAAVTGAYMVLFPKTEIVVMYMLFFIGTFEIDALYFILFKMIIYDNFLEPQLTGGGNVAYLAHMAGYAYGILVPLALLGMKLLPHSHYDLWALLDRWRRRKRYQRVVSRGFDPYHPSFSERIKVKASVKDVDDPTMRRVQTLREEFTSEINNKNLASAAGKYVELKQLDPGQILPQQPLLDVANQFMHDGKHREAAGAYEDFLSHYKRQYPFIEQIELMLGLIYSRYLNQPGAAEKHLSLAMEKLADSTQKQMCREELERLKNRGESL